MFQRLGTTVLIALGFILVGFIAIGLAWNGAAGVDYVQGQVPYLISGGVLGLALIGIGGVIVLFEAGRRVTQRLDERLDRLAEVIGAGSLGSSNGSAPKQPAAPPAKDAVVIGDASFHRQGCRLVEGKSELIYASIDDARDRGLKACRVCDPLTPDDQAPKRRSARR